MLAESQNVTHPNRFSHYIMMTQVKKPTKAIWLKAKPSTWTKASLDHAAARCAVGKKEGEEVLTIGDTALDLNI